MKYIEIDAQNKVICWYDGDNVLPDANAIAISDADALRIENSATGHRGFVYTGGVLVDNTAAHALSENKQAKIDALKLETAQRIKAIIPNRLDVDDVTIIAAEVAVFVDTAANKTALVNIYNAARAIGSDIKNAATQTELDAIDIANDGRWP